MGPARSHYWLMIRLVRWPLLVAALIAFTLEVATVANLRCDMTQAGQATAGPAHVGHSGHQSKAPSPGAHQSGTCICIAGCHLGLGLGAPVVTALAELRPIGFQPGSAEPTPPLPLAARPFVLPLALAPPIFA